MSSTRISETLRRQIERDSQNRSGYCLTPAAYMPVRFEIEHIIPESAGGRSERTNLWLSCPSCNRFKATKTHAPDPATQVIVPLYHPRTQNWSEHFEWSEDGLRIIGRTSIGRATVNALKLNHEWWIECRSEWALRKNFPPKK